MSEPAWFISRVDQRVALVQDVVGGKWPFPTVVLTPLTEPPESATQEQRLRWERTCDNCGTHCPQGTAFYTGHVSRELPDKRQVIITFGVCKSCCAGFS